MKPQKQKEYKLAVRTPGGAIIEPKLKGLVVRGWSDKDLAEMYCAGINDYRECCASRGGRYIVVEASA